MPRHIQANASQYRFPAAKCLSNLINLAPCRFITGATSSQFWMISMAPAASAAIAIFAGERLITVFRYLIARDNVPMETPTPSSAAPI
jgi:hypothetical protein